MPPLRHVAILLTLCSAPLAAQGGGGTPPDVAEAQRLYAAKDYQGAIARLEAFFQKNPQAVAGRLLLGNAHRELGHLDAALAAYQSVTQPPPIRLQASFNAAAIHARKGEPDQALGLLAQLKQSGAFDMDLARGAPEFAALAKDPRFEAAMFRPADFERPFVEPTRVIHEWVGETRGDQFSWIARSIPDVDGDKVREVVTSAPTWGAESAPAGPGKVYLYSGRSGKLLWERVGDSAALLGFGLEGAGDVNRDGIADVAAGAPGVERAFVFSGRDGKTLLTLAAAGPNEGFGRSASGAGDQNGDGHADVLVGAPNGAGKAYLFSGKDGALLRTWQGDAPNVGFGSVVAGAREGAGGPLLVGAPGAGTGGRGRVYVYQGVSATPRFVVDSDADGAALGAMFTSVVGDVDGDRTPDIYASDFTAAVNGPSTGRIYLHSGKDGHRIRSLTGEAAGIGFGIGSADLGDIDKDGYDDLVIGAWQFAGAAPSGGKVYLYSGRTGQLIRSITGRIPGETFGFDATGAGDVDGDGVIDLLLTSSWSNIKGFRSGRMYLISGR